MFDSPLFRYVGIPVLSALYSTIIRGISEGRKPFVEENFDVGMQLAVAASIGLAIFTMLLHTGSLPTPVPEGIQCRLNNGTVVVLIQGVFVTLVAWVSSAFRGRQFRLVAIAFKLFFGFLNLIFLSWWIVF